MNRNEELDRYLSGESSMEDLPKGLRSEERALRELLGTLREDVRAPSTLRGRVMREIEAIPTPLWRRVVDWCLRPRTIRLSPAAGGLAFAATAAILLLVTGVRPTDDEVVADATRGDVVTRFVFIAPEASSVQMTGDFVDWSPEGITLVDERGTGIWTVDVPLEPGVYQYAFVVDGEEWRPDPRAVSQVDDGFGRENSVVIVSGESDT